MIQDLIVLNYYLNNILNFNGKSITTAYYWILISMNNSWRKWDMQGYGKSSGIKLNYFDDILNTFDSI